MSLKGIGENRHLLRGKINNLELMALSAYDIAVKNGYTGTEEDWLLSLQGGVYIDKTLSIDGVGADAKTTGDSIKANANAITANRQAVANAQNTIDNHKADNLNPHNVTAAQVGLGNVDNTSDLDKPVSTAQAEAIAKAKEEMLKSANDAQTSANNAQTSADNAQTSANNAQTSADNAQATADEAKGTANAALPISGGNMTGTIGLKGIILTDGEDYGLELPTVGNKGRLFFKVVE
jgi:hypothetical protein